MAYGHGISVSLLQIARAYTIFTGDGHLLPLSLVKRENLPIGRPLVSRETAREVARMLEMAVGPGRHRAARGGPRLPASPARPARRTSPRRAATRRSKYVSSFVGFGPVSNPRFVVAVMLDEPSGGEVLRRRRERAGVRLRDGCGAAHVLGAAGRAADAQRPGARAPGRHRGARAAPRGAKDDRRGRTSRAPPAPSSRDRLAQLGVPLVDLTTDSRAGEARLRLPRLSGQRAATGAPSSPTPSRAARLRSSGSAAASSGTRAWDVPNLAVEGLRGARERDRRARPRRPVREAVDGRRHRHQRQDLGGQWVAQALDGLGRRAAVLGTLGNGLVGERAEAKNTTPDAVVLQRELADYLRRGAKVAAMEVSSHGLDQERAAAIKFDVAVFTNLTRDHLDYHGTMEAYAEAKYRLVQRARGRPRRDQRRRRLGKAIRGPAPRIACRRDRLRARGRAPSRRVLRADRRRGCACGSRATGARARWPRPCSAPSTSPTCSP